MKIKLSLLRPAIVLLVLCFITTNSFSQTSVKGNWTKAEKEKAIAEMNTTRGQLDELVGEAGAQLIIDCAIEKIQMQYKNFAEAVADYDGMHAIGKSCAEEVIASGISIKGQWNDTDLEKARAEINSEREAMESAIGKDGTDQFMNCALNKLEQAYPNFEAANSDLSGAELIGEECANEILDGGISMQGNWSEKDLSRARASLEEERAAIDELIGREKTNELFDCAIKTIEQNYPNFYTADKDIDGMAKIGEECMLRILEE